MRRLSTVYEENKAQIARILDLFGEGFTAMTELSVRGARFSLFCMRGVDGASDAAELIKRSDSDPPFELTYSLDKMIEAVFCGRILILSERLKDGALISDGSIKADFTDSVVKNAAAVRSCVKGAPVSVISLKNEGEIYGAVCCSEKWGGKHTALKALKSAGRGISQVEEVKNSLFRPLAVKPEDGERVAELLSMGKCVAFVEGEARGCVLNCGWNEIFTSKNRGRWHRVYLQIIFWTALVLPALFLLAMKGDYLISLSELWILLSFSVGELLFFIFQKEGILIQSVFWLSAALGGFVSMAFVPTLLFVLILTREQSREGEGLILIFSPIFLLMSAIFGVFGLILSSAALGIGAILLERRSFLDRIGKR